MSEKKILVVGEVFSPNLGDYAIFDSISTILKKKGIKSIPIDLSLRKDWSNNDYSSSTTPWITIFSQSIKQNILYKYLAPRIKWYFINKIRTEEYWDALIKNSDGVIIGGGQLITSSSAFFLPKINLIVKVAKRNNKPYSIVGCGVGNDISFQDEKLCSKILSEASYISLRDNGSEKKLRSYIHADTVINVYPDLAFALQPTKKNTTYNKSKNICGFNILPLSAFQRFNSNLNDFSEGEYLNFWKKMFESAIGQGMKVVITTNGSPDDYKQAREIWEFVSKCGIEVSLLDRPIYPQDLYKQIESLDFLVAMRMHAGIIGHAFGKLVCTIVWDNKIPDVWNVVGGSEAVIDCNILKHNDPWSIVQNSFCKSRTVLNNRDLLRDTVLNGIDECLASMVYKNLNH